MKILKLLSLIVSITFTFSSCSTNETLIQEEQSTDLLKSYTIKRDATGAYSLDFDFNENVAIEKVIDSKTNTNQFYLYPSDSQIRSKGIEKVAIDSGELKVGFIDANSDIFSHVTILDDNAYLAKGKNDKLKDYSITSNQDGTYNLDFSVNNKVRVDFVYNEDIDTYEIHLEEGSSDKTSFSRVLEKTDNEPLKFDFVNHIVGAGAQARGVEATSIIRKPRGIII